MMSGISAVEFAALAANVYAEPKDAPKGSRVFRWTRQNFLGDPTNGFFAAAYHSGKSAQLVIAYRGSGGDLGDWGLNGNLGNMLGVTSSKLAWNSQLNTAITYFDACRSIYSPSNIAVCGHSLGGFLAAMVALKKGVRGITFDRPSLFYSRIATLTRDAAPSGSNLVNFRGRGDPVSSIRDGYGKWITVELNTLSNITAGRGRAALAHSIDELYEAILLHPKSDSPPEAW
jgi:pimeloyl-ACP methyl ester carboxylesterase